MPRRSTFGSRLAPSTAAGSERGCGAWRALGSRTLNRDVRLQERGPLWLQACPGVLSRSARPARQLGMKGNRDTSWTWLRFIVLAHLVVSMVHGTAHARAHVPCRPAASLFVYTVILAGPLVGLALTWPAERIGSWLIAATMAGSFVFGLVNHFVLASADHVAYVDPQWRALFAATALLLAVTEAVGSGLAVRLARGGRLS